MPLQEIAPQYEDYMIRVSSEEIKNYHKPMNDKQNMDQQALKVANVLQTSLDLNKLIEMFAEKLAEFVAHDSLLYINKEEDLELLVGKPGLNTCTYQVTLLEKSLGEVTISRQKPFDENEIKWFESLLCSLIYPLHNALLYKQAIQSAYKDPVTGVNNRAAMDATLEREVELAHRTGAALSVIMLDIDHFKHINDKYGHLAGDAVLKGVGSCLTECIRRSDIVFRYGGEEFAVILNTTDIDGANFLANRIRVAIEKRNFEYDGLKVNITISAGVALLEKDYEARDLIDAADRALYQAKKAGRNLVVVYDPKNDASTDSASA